MSTCWTKVALLYDNKKIELMLFLEFCLFIDNVLHYPAVIVNLRSLLNKFLVGSFVS